LTGYVVKPAREHAWMHGEPFAVAGGWIMPEGWSRDPWCLKVPHFVDQDI
jgi:hypothetical protein